MQPTTAAPLFAPGAKSRLTAKDLGRFATDSLFDRVGRAVCAAGCLPRKELYEAWETARRTRRLFRGGRVVDVAGGHGLLAHLLLLLDDTSPAAIVVDPAVPPSADALQQAMIAAWPRLRDRVILDRRSHDHFTVRAGDLVVSSHACGALTDRVIDAAIAARAPVVVLPCCHDLETCECGAFRGWVDGALAIDLVRVTRLERAGYHVWTQTIPKAITPKNRLLLARPSDPPAAGSAGPTR